LADDHAVFVVFGFIFDSSGAFWRVVEMIKFAEFDKFGRFFTNYRVSFALRSKIRIPAARI
jgi:hypothetical protein